MHTCTQTNSRLCLSSGCLLLAEAFFFLALHHKVMATQNEANCSWSLQKPQKDSKAPNPVFTNPSLRPENAQLLWGRKTYSSYLTRWRMLEEKGLISNRLHFPAPAETTSLCGRCTNYALAFTIAVPKLSLLFISRSFNPLSRGLDERGSHFRLEKKN